jgi:hypothetical protein
VTFAILKRITDDPLNALASIDIFLRCDFIRSSLFEDATGIRIDPFGVFQGPRSLYLWARLLCGRAASSSAPPHVGVQSVLKRTQQNFLAWMLFTRGSPPDQDGVEVAAQRGKAVWRHRGLIAQWRSAPQSKWVNAT